MDEFLRFFLPIYWILFFCVVLFFRTYVVWRRTGFNAYKSLIQSGVHGVIVFYNKSMPVISTSVVIVYSFFPQYYFNLAPFPLFQHDAIALLGVLFLLFSLGWIWFSQSQMGDVWRLAPKDASADYLVSSGIFSRSRNPIFLGVKVNLIGIFLVLPNGVIFALVVMGWVLLDVQVALEEEHLLSQHGESYKNYCSRVRRWI